MADFGQLTDVLSKDLNEAVVAFHALDYWGNYAGMPVPDELLDEVQLGPVIAVRQVTAQVRELMRQHDVNILRWLTAEAEYKLGVSDG